MVHLCNVRGAWVSCLVVVELMSRRRGNLSQLSVSDGRRESVFCIHSAAATNTDHLHCNSSATQHVSCLPPTQTQDNKISAIFLHLMMANLRDIRVALSTKFPMGSKVIRGHSIIFTQVLEGKARDSRNYGRIVSQGPVI